MTHWKAKVKEYNEQKGPVDRISDNLKLVCLQNAFKLVPELNAVKTTATTFARQIGKPLSYDLYLSMIESEVVTYEADQAKLVGRNRSIHQILIEGYHEEEDESPVTFPDNVRDLTPTEFLAINKHQQ